MTPFRVKPSVTFKRQFSLLEDQTILKRVAQFGAKNWDLIASVIPERTGRQCRERYYNYLSPEITNSPWTPEEDQILIQEVQISGSSWSKIAPKFPGRSPNNIKNRWYKVLSKRLSQPHEPIAISPTAAPETPVSVLDPITSTDEVLPPIDILPIPFHDFQEDAFSDWSFM